jgi:hypothetical protein
LPSGCKGYWTFDRDGHGQPESTGQLFTYSRVITGQSQAQGGAGRVLNSRIGRKVCLELGGFLKTLLNRYRTSSHKDDFKRGISLRARFTIEICQHRGLSISLQTWMPTVLPWTERP